ncbi:MAG: abortive infection family protein [Acidimicrobiales bacterium]
MAELSVNEELIAALRQFFYGGAGPTHARISAIFTRTGYGDAAPYDAATGTPNKETRVEKGLRAAMRRPARSRELVEGLLIETRQRGCFDPGHDDYRLETVERARRAFAKIGWTLSSDGNLTTTAGIDLTTGGRRALDEQVERLRRGTEDPGVLLGSAKDLLEAVAKFVAEELGMPLTGREDYGHLWHLVRDRLGILPQQVAAGTPGEDAIRKVLGAAWTIAEQTNRLRGLQGAGHGRTLPTGVSAPLALLVVREACSISEFALAQLDLNLGRSA